MFTQTSHLNDDSQEDTDDQPSEWAVAQVRASRGDYSYNSMIWCAISGGLHLQSVHHVFPMVHWAHYPSIYRYVWNAAREERKPKNIGTVLCEHFAFVSRINGGKA